MKFWSSHGVWRPEVDFATAAETDWNMDTISIPGVSTASRSASAKGECQPHRGGDPLLQSLVHGVVLMEQLSPLYGAERRRLRVIKLREVKFRGGYHDLTIRHEGVVVFPRLVAAEQLNALEEARRDRRPGDREPDRLKSLPRFELEPLCERAKLGLDPLGREGLDTRERLASLA